MNRRQFSIKRMLRIQTKLTHTSELILRILNGILETLNSPHQLLNTLTNVMQRPSWSIYRLTPIAKANFRLNWFNFSIWTICRHSNSIHRSILLVLHQIGGHSQGPSNYTSRRKRKNPLPQTPLSNSTAPNMTWHLRKRRIYNNTDVTRYCRTSVPQYQMKHCSLLVIRLNICPDIWLSRLIHKFPLYTRLLFCSFCRTLSRLESTKSGNRRCKCPKCCNPRSNSIWVHQFNSPPTTDRKLSASSVNSSSTCSTLQLDYRSSLTRMTLQ